MEFCIPILVNASVAYDVSERPTPEMVEQAGLFEKGFMDLSDLANLSCYYRY